MQISNRHLGLAISLALAMLLTRGSHALTSVSLPDASLIVMLVGGAYLRSWRWFAAFFAFSFGIDLFAAQQTSAYAYCLTPAYWGMLPTNAIMWFAGKFLAQQTKFLAPVQYYLTVLISAFLAFVVSTQTYYLFSGRFDNQGILDTLQYGWNYLPSWMTVNLSYATVAWFTAQAVIRLASIQPSAKQQGT